MGHLKHVNAFFHLMGRSGKGNEECRLCQAKTKRKPKVQSHVIFARVWMNVVSLMQDHVTVPCSRFQLFPPRDRDSFLHRTTPLFMPNTRASARAQRQPLSLHTSNPFDDVDARRVLGVASCEPSEFSSDLGGYGEPGRPRTPQIDAQEVARDAEVAIEAEVEGDEEMTGDEIVYGGIADGSQGSDIDGDGRDDDFWDEEAMEEEHSIYFRPIEERREIEEEIEDLQRAVPRLREDYEIIDRLGTGACSFLLRQGHAAQFLQVLSRPYTRRLTSDTMNGTTPHGVVAISQDHLAATNP